MRWLITGASGLLGQHLLRAIPGTDECVGSYMRTPVDGGVQVDVRDAAAVAKAMSSGFDVCIHCAANPNVADCENNPEEAVRLNIGGTQNVADACEDFGVRLVHVSTDSVFDGTKNSPYVEGDERNPLQVYGRTKADAEDVVRGRQNALIVRVPLLYGRASREARQTWLEQCVEALRAGGSVAADDRELRQPAYAGDIASVLVQLGNSVVEGTVHATPDEVLTKFAWSRRIADAFGLNPELIEPTYEPPAGPPRPQRSILAADRLRALDIESPRGVTAVLQSSPGLADK